VLYAVLSAGFGLVATVVSRVKLERQRGRRRAAAQLPAGPIIVISNHTSYADGVLLALACRRLGRSLRLLAMSGVFAKPVLGWITRTLGFIPVARGSISAAGALDAAAAALEAGEAVGIFPEGRVTRDPDRWPERAKTGAVRLAVRTGAPIVPVAMVGAHRIMGRRRLVWHLLKSAFTRPRVEVAVGAPIQVRSLVDSVDAPSAASLRKATDVVMGELVRLIAELREESPPTDEAA
jgi:1-acyl-sn-glycerol-3-phosphate acyltransferase